MRLRQVAPVPLLLPLALALACANGLPAGGRAFTDQARYRPLAIASPPRSMSSAPTSPELAVAGPSSPGGREQVVSLARSLVGARTVELNGRRYSSDCSGLVVAVYDQVGVRLGLDGIRRGDNSVSALYQAAAARGRVFSGGRPLPGDLVFFRETYDVNRDGRLNDGLTHVGIVENVDEDETVTVIHRVGTGIVRYRMNLKHPNQRTDDRNGLVWNDALRSPGSGSRTVLTGQLFAAYATLL